MTFDKIFKSVEGYYSEKVAKHGATAEGVDWNSKDSQELRFGQLLKVCDERAGFSINDYGCGYGALADYMLAEGYTFEYRGFDISRMIDEAKRLHARISGLEFFTDKSLVADADYTVASGIFNVKLQASVPEWERYVLHILDEMSAMSRHGFAFNILTAYSDAGRRRPDLYYADPLFFFDHCKKNYSRFVSLHHDYPLFEFTITVKKGQ